MILKISINTNGFGFIMDLIISGMIIPKNINDIIDTVANVIKYGVYLFISDPPKFFPMALLKSSIFGKPYIPSTFFQSVSNLQY